MSDEKKSQITAEFLLIIGFLFIMSIGFILASAIQMKEFSDNKDLTAINSFGESLKTELDLASVVKDGYERTVTIPQKIDDRIEYTLNMASSTLTVETDDYEFNAIIPRTEGILKKGPNTIRKVGSTVIIENAP